MPVPVEFLFFGATLVGVALFHKRTLLVATAGLATIVAWKLAFAGFDEGSGLRGLAAHLRHEWVLLANLALLLTGFELLARHFEQSRVMDLAPRILPDDWTGGLVMLFLVFLVSGVLDNIAAALLGGTLARHIFQGKVTLAYLAAIVAAANAGGAGSVLGDTTTTMLWLGGAHPTQVLHAYVGALVAFAVFAPAAAVTQHRAAPIVKHAPDGAVDWTRVGIAAACLIVALAANIGANVLAPDLPDHVPVLGLAVWATLLAAWIWRKPDLHVLPAASAGTLFLLALVLAASLMPVKALPAPTEWTTLGLGFVSAIFDNIPLTKLAIDQGGYDWPFLAYAVGFGGSMLWFGSSAGVAISNLYPEAKSAFAWLRAGWLIPVGYVAGFFVMRALFGWSPEPLGG